MLVTWSLSVLAATVLAVGVYVLQKFRQFDPFDYVPLEVPDDGRAAIEMPHQRKSRAEDLSGLLPGPASP